MSAGTEQVKLQLCPLPAGILVQQRESEDLKSCLCHKPAVLLQAKHNLLGAQFPYL